MRSRKLLSRPTITRVHLMMATSVAAGAAFYQVACSDSSGGVAYNPENAVSGVLNVDPNSASELAAVSPSQQHIAPGITGITWMSQYVDPAAGTLSPFENEILSTTGSGSSGVMVTRNVTQAIAGGASNTLTGFVGGNGFEQGTSNVSPYELPGGSTWVAGSPLLRSNLPQLTPPSIPSDGYNYNAVNYLSSAAPVGVVRLAGPASNIPIFAFVNDILVTEQVGNGNAQMVTPPGTRQVGGLWSYWIQDPDGQGFLPVGRIYDTFVNGPSSPGSFVGPNDLVISTVPAPFTSSPQTTYGDSARDAAVNAVILSIAALPSLLTLIPSSVGPANSCNLGGGCSGGTGPNPPSIDRCSLPDNTLYSSFDAGIPIADASAPTADAAVQITDAGIPTVKADAAPM